MRRSRSLLRPGTVLTAAVLAFLLVAAPTGASSSADGVTITPTVDGIVGANGWYRGSSHGNNVVLHWTVSDPGLVVLSTSGCEPAITITGPTTGTTRTCTATTATTSVSVKTDPPIKIDADPPTGVLPTASRSPDANGWYNHPFAVSWSGSDAISGVAGCTSIGYGGPDSGAANFAGSCTDEAGNVATSSFSFKYDATAPILSKVSVDSGAQADVVHWKSSSPTDSAVVRRVARGKKNGPTVFHGTRTSYADRNVRPDTEYRYVVRTYDEAGNASKPISVVAMPKVVTLGPNTSVPRTADRPILRWSRVSGASYYHVQLFRAGRRILAAWPLTPTLPLHHSWRWSGHRYLLTAGRYRWYAWAGFGPRSAAHYKLLGRGDFVVG